MKKTFYVAIALFILYFFWLKTDRAINNEIQKNEKIIVESFGDFSKKQGNILGLQIFMNPVDYSSKERFKSKIKSYFEKAKQNQLIIEGKTVIVLPEYLGTWLVVLNEKNSVYQAQKVGDALQTLVLCHPFDFLKAYLSAPDDCKDKVKHAVFAMKSKEMAENYQAVFSELAKEYKLMIVAGSILLQNPVIKNGKIEIQAGALKNVSFVFDENGNIQNQIVQKSFPTADEMPFVAINLPQKNIFKTPIGSMKVLICADAWFDEMYQSDGQKIDFVLVPSYSSGSNFWNKSWTGYSGFETPLDAKSSVEKITLGKAWQDFAMAGRAKKANILKGMNVFLQGNLWDLGTDGSTIVLNDSTFATQAFNKPAIFNLWLP
jgi:predicted amidohydrolase